MREVLIISSGIISMLIPLVVIILAIFTKRIIPSLTVGILAGGILLAKGDIIQGIIKATEHLVKAAADEESIYIIMFLFVFGAFGEIMKTSGGIKRFTNLTSKYVKTEKGALGAVWLITPVTFIDCCFHDIAAGTVGKALIDKVQGNKRKFAHVINVTSCLLIILIPFGTTYIGYIVGVISSAFNKARIQQSAYAMYIKSIPFNLYGIVMLLISIGAIVFNFGFKTQIYSKVGKKQLEESEHGSYEAHEQCEFEEKAPPRPLNLIIPLALLIIKAFFLFGIPGKMEAVALLMP